MKAILVIDIDDELLDKYEDFYVDYDLRATDKEDDFVDSIRYVEDCPLRPLPQKVEMDMNEYYEGVADGWNNCIDTIVGETE